jgi:hypothetical protein
MWRTNKEHTHAFKRACVCSPLPGPTRPSFIIIYASLLIKIVLFIHKLRVKKHNLQTVFVPPAYVGSGGRETRRLD